MQASLLFGLIKEDATAAQALFSDLGEKRRFLSPSEADERFLKYLLILLTFLASLVSGWKKALRVIE